MFFVKLYLLNLEALCLRFVKYNIMKIRFNIEYYTRWGQRLFLRVLSPSLLFNKDKNILTADANAVMPVTIPMEYVEKNQWQLEVESQENIELSYCYVFVDEDGKETEEPNSHTVLTDDTKDIYDEWQNNLNDKIFFSSAFSDNIFSDGEKKKKSVSRKLKGKKRVTIQCYAPTIRPNQEIRVSGENNIFGNWIAEKALLMKEISESLWSITLEYEDDILPCSIKFIIFDKHDKNIYYWESGDNRIIRKIESDGFNELLFRGFHLKDPLHQWRGAGVAIPVFSLKSNESYGIGEFNDIIKLVDWAAKTGLNVIQILPINDTTINRTWQDSYPYNAMSNFALHPVYINPLKAGILNDAEKMSEYEKEKERLNSLVSIDYDAVTKLKWNYLKELYQQDKSKVFKSKAYKDFFNDNKDWLIPYAAFSYLRDLYDTPDFNWWEKHSVYDQKEIEILTNSSSEEYDEIAFFYFIQYLLHIQLKEASEYAANNGVVLKGDIPIGISRNSVEAWSNPELFNLDGQAGAPPDDFSINGQNWGFPTYRWDVMAKDNYSWWKRRFEKMSDYFQAYRIDHILGFFRIWEIPTTAVQGLLGYFNPALPYSIDEINRFGFWFDQSQLTAHMNEDEVASLFGENKEMMISDFLTKNENGEYYLIKEFDTQREISNFLKGPSDLKTKNIVDNLFDFAANVLFIEDPYKPGHYHPRISAHSTKAYQRLDDGQKWAFDNLYKEFFYHRHNDFWAKEAMKKLPELISSTKMLACGEDLGMIPASVEGVMNFLKILSLEIQRMPKTHGVTFDNPENYPYLSVCTTSTHDMSPIREWWTESPQQSQLFYNNILKRPGMAPVECTTSICDQIVESHLNSPAILTILPLQDWMSIDEEIRNPDYKSERIHIPANPRHYWRYRMHLSLEELNDAEDFNGRILEMNKKAGRGNL